MGPSLDPNFLYLRSQFNKGLGLVLIDCKSSFVSLYLVSELPRVLTRCPGAVSVGLIDQDLHPAA